MDEIQQFFHFYRVVIGEHLLRLLALGGGVLIVSLSPLGRGLLRHLRERRADRGINEQLLSELEHHRAALGEVTERLDATERLLSSRGDMSHFPGQSTAEPRPQVNTPH